MLKPVRWAISVGGLEAMPHITDSGLARLTRIEVHGLRIALRLPRSAPHSLVYREAGVHILLSAAKYKFRCQTVTNSTVHEVEESFRGPAQGRLCSSICDSAVSYTHLTLPTNHRV